MGSWGKMKDDQISRGSAVRESPISVAAASLPVSIRMPREVNVCLLGNTDLKWKAVFCASSSTWESDTVRIFLFSQVMHGHGCSQSIRAYQTVQRALSNLASKGSFLGNILYSHGVTYAKEANEYGETSLLFQDSEESSHTGPDDEVMREILASFDVIGEEASFWCGGSIAIADAKPLELRGEKPPWGAGD